MKKTEKKLTSKRVGEWALYILVVTAVFTAITVATRGWPLFFAHPEAEDIQCVTITQSATGNGAGRRFQRGFGIDRQPAGLPFL